MEEITTRGSWYKFTCDHGGGHQSHDVKYQYFSEDPDESVLKDYAESWISRNYWADNNSAIYSFEKVQVLPLSILKNQRRKYEERIAEAKRMLAILDEAESSTGTEK